MTATKEKLKKPGIKLSAADLLAALSDVMRAVPGATPKPVLTNVLIGDGMISGTDLEVRIDRMIGEMCDAFLIPAGRLQQILRTVNRDADVQLIPGERSVTIKAGGGKWEIPTEPAVEFPTCEPKALKPIARMPADQFTRAVRGTVYAVDAESSRFSLGCVLLEVQNGTATFVATDGRRLSAVEAEIDQAVDDSATQIPARAIRIMAALAEKTEGSVQLEASSGEVVCTIDGATITARLTDGRFPRWRDVFPDRDCEPSVVPVEALRAATRAAAVCTSEQSKGVTFEFGSVLKLTSRSSEAGEARVTCDVTKSGQAAKVSLDPLFVREFLEGLTSEDEPHVDIEAAGPGDAVILRNGDVRGVIMPLAQDS